MSVPKTPMPVREFHRVRVDRTLIIFRDMLTEAVIGWHITGRRPVFLELLAEGSGKKRSGVEIEAMTELAIHCAREHASTAPSHIQRMMGL